MDSTAVGVIASATVSLIAPYLKRLTGEFAKGFATEAGEATWNAAAKVFDNVKSRFSSNSGTTGLISALRMAPDDEELQTVIRFHLKEIMETDEAFATELVHSLQLAAEKGVDNMFQTDISTKIAMVTHIGTVHGTVVIDGKGSFLDSIWELLEPELQDALSLALNQATREGKKTIRTRYFFAALARLRPEPLSELMQQIPEAALPKPVGENVQIERHILADEPHLSACIEDSLTHLSERASAYNRVSTTDMFVDIAKHGTGRSVARLRENGVSPQRVDEIVHGLGWVVIER